MTNAAIKFYSSQKLFYRVSEAYDSESEIEHTLWHTFTFECAVITERFLGNVTVCPAVGHAVVVSKIPQIYGTVKASPVMEITISGTI